MSIPSASAEIIAPAGATDAPNALLSKASPCRQDVDWHLFIDEEIIYMVSPPTVTHLHSGMSHLFTSMFPKINPIYQNLIPHAREKMCP